MPQPLDVPQSETCRDCGFQVWAANAVPLGDTVHAGFVCHACALAYREIVTQGQQD